MPVTSIAAAAAGATAIRQAVMDYFTAASRVHDAYNEATSQSLTKYTKQATLRSRVYIDGMLKDDPVVPDILRTCHILYDAMIYNSLALNKFVAGGQRVRDALAFLATESDKPWVDVGAELSMLSGSMESSPLDYIKNPNQLVDDFRGKVVPKRVREKSENRGYTVGRIEPAAPNSLPVGTTLEVKLQAPEKGSDAGGGVSVMLTVLMVPYFIDPVLVSAFINKDTEPSFWQKLIQWRAGEISFWRDLVFCMNSIEKQRDYLRRDKDGLMLSQIDDRYRKDKALAISAAKVAATGDLSHVSHNLANAVMVFSREAVDAARAETGIRLEDPHVRQHYFDQTYSMMLLVVDRTHNQITLYMNGVNDHAVYSFRDFEKPGKDKDADLVKILTAIVSGRAPRL